MNKIEIAKHTASVIVGLGTGKIVKDIIKNNTEIVTRTDMVTVASASVVIGSMASDATREYTDAKIDAVVAWYNEKFNKDS